MITQGQIDQAFLTSAAPASPGAVTQSAQLDTPTAADRGGEARIQCRDRLGGVVHEYFLAS
jgi:hypothetical protein